MELTRVTTKKGQLHKMNKGSIYSSDSFQKDLSLNLPNQINKGFKKKKNDSSWPTLPNQKQEKTKDSKKCFCFPLVYIW